MSAKRLAGILLVSTVLSFVSFSYVKGNGYENLLIVRDDYESSTKLNIGETDAEVDLEETNLKLPLNPAAVSIKFDGTEVAVRDKDVIKIYATTKTGLILAQTLNCPKVASVSYSKTAPYLFASTEDKVVVYLQGVNGYSKVGEFPVSMVVAVEGAEGRNVWVLTKQAVHLWYFRSDGNYTQKSMATLQRGKNISYSPDGKAVAVMDENKVRYFKLSGASLIELPGCSTTIADAIAVTLVKGGYRVLTKGNGTKYFTVQGNSVISVSSFDTPDSGFAICHNNANPKEFATLTANGIRYEAQTTGPIFTDQPAKQTTDPVEVGYKKVATAVSAVFESEVPVSRLRATMRQTLPPNTTVRLDVSTDGGVTWEINIPLDTNVDVREGDSLVYRITLESTDPYVTPTVDLIELLQVHYIIDRHIPGITRVRLIP